MLWVTWPAEKSNSRLGPGMRRRSFQMSLRERRKPAVVKSRKEISGMRDSKERVRGPQPMYWGEISTVFPES
jgi:hypothetical protein